MILTVRQRLAWYYTKIQILRNQRPAFRSGATLTRQLT